jgi:4-amino-4-deoxy-L-arabinose transferase-like glycosyltransferase
MAFRLIGIALFILPFIPLFSIFKGIKGVDYATTPGQWLLSLSIALPIAWFGNTAISDERADRLASKLSAAFGKVSPRLIALSFIAIAACLFLLTHFVFNYRPHLIDTIVQLFQAETFAAGRLKAVTPPLSGFFMTQHMLIDAGGWYGQYPPGHPALLAVAAFFGAPWICNILLTLGTCGMLYLSTKRIYSESSAQLLLLLMLFCPFLLFMGASYMNHVPTLFFVSTFLYFFIRWEQDSRGIWITCAGVALAAGFLCRPLTALAIGVPFACFSLSIVSQSKRYLHILFGLFGFLSLASVYFLFNKLTTGDPFLPGYLKLWGESHGLGFHISPWGKLHTPWTGLRNELTDLSTLHENLFESLLPGMWPIALFFIFYKRLSVWDKRLLIAFFALPTAYFFYWHRDAFLGPRFQYSSLAFILPLSARALMTGIPAASNSFLKIPGLFRAVRASHFLTSLVAVSLIYTITMGVPHRFAIMATSLKTLKFDITKEAKDQGIERGLIFIAVSWGNRLLAQLREFGLPASLAQKAYSYADHCLLQELLVQSQAKGLTANELIKEVEAILAKEEKLVAPRLNNDPTLRLRAGVRLTRRCTQELRYDQQGYGVYMGSLRGNTPTLDGPYIVVRDLRKRNFELMKKFPNYPAYLYRDKKFTPIP